VLGQAVSAHVIGTAGGSRSNDPFVRPGSPDGRHLYFSSERGGTMSLWRIEINESTGETMGVPEPVLTGVQAAPELPSLSTDGQRMVFRSSVVTANPVAIGFDPNSLQVREWRPLRQRSG
jgi:Tol biopolymer transport system component